VTVAGSPADVEAAATDLDDTARRRAVDSRRALD
jgi:hypothetical protein